MCASEMRGRQLHEHADHIGQHRPALSGEAGQRFVSTVLLGRIGPFILTVLERVDARLC